MNISGDKPRLFAFGYTARVGKDTAAEYLISKRGGYRLSFASALYDILHYAQNKCGFPIEKDRKFLQYIGTEWAREKDENIWVNIILKQIKLYLEEIPGVYLYITDVRFPNEFEALKEIGFTLVNIKREDKESLGNGSSQHASEISLLPYEDKWDITINNNGTLEEFYQELDRI